MHFKAMIAFAAAAALLGPHIADAQQRSDPNTGQPSYEGNAPMHRGMSRGADRSPRREYFPREATDKGDVPLRPQQRAQLDADEAETTRQLNEQQLRDTR